MLFRSLLPFALLLVFADVSAGTNTLSPSDGRAPDFVLSDIDGAQVRLDDFRGKVLVVNFWAVWCKPCREEMPSLDRGSRWLERFNGSIITINMGDSPEMIRRFLEKNPVDLPILLDADAEISTNWGVTGLPTTFVVDPEGRIAYRAMGPREWDDPALLVPIRAVGLKRH